MRDDDAQHRVRDELRTRWRLWRWVIGVGVAAAGWGAGVLIYDHTRGHWQCRYNPAVVTDPRAACDRGVNSTGWHHVSDHNGWGALVALLGVFLLSWLVPLLVGRRLNPRPPRPERIWPSEKVWWSGGAWQTRGRGHYWEYEPRRREWHRRKEIPLMGATRSETWALHRDELLREQNRLLEDQNRLLAGLPPLPREEVPDVIEGVTPRGAPGTNETNA